MKKLFSFLVAVITSFKGAFITQKTHRTFLSFTIFFLFTILIVPVVSAQDITFNVKSYKGGYNISCNGSTNGNIDVTIVGGVMPYNYSWSNGATTQDLTNISAGIYTLTVTDAVGSIKSKSITLFEPDLMEVFFTTSIYEGGYQISKMGNNDGFITTDVKGGAPPYKYLWNTGSQKANLDKLIAGVYSVVVTDQNGCSVTKNVTLIEPTPITLTLTATNYGSYNTSCFESKDGNINLTVAGGMPPYRYNWSSGSFDEDLNNVPSGIYKVQVTDVNKATVVGQITLTQPSKLEVNLTVSNYSNGYNISCTNCFNGSITTIVTGGTLPSTYLWKGPGTSDGQTTANLTSLGPGGYYVLVTDANNCRTESKAFLSEPPTNAWDKSGSIADPSNFLGTTNNAALIMKTNNTEGMRISETGNVGIGTASPAFKLDVNGDANVSGNLKTMGNLSFGGEKQISYRAPTGTTPAAFGWGTPIHVIDPVLDLPYCFAPTSPTINVFPGMIYSYGNSAYGGQLNVMRTGFDGANGIIDIAGINDLENSPSLLINYYCGKNVFVCTGPDGGNVQLTSSGKVGIGISSPTEKLDVGGNIKLNNNVLYLKNDHFHGLKFTTSFSGATMDGPVLFGYTNGALGTTGGGGEKTALYWNSDGNVGIGTNLRDASYDNTYKLAVNGKIRAKDVVVEIGWSDFVFDEKFVRMTLLEKELYYLKEKHLPNIENGKTIEMNGLQVGKTMSGMMQNIEENTLDMVELYKKMQEIEKASKALEKENKELKERIVQLEHK